MGDKLKEDYVVIGVYENGQNGSVVIKETNEEARQLAFDLMTKRKPEKEAFAEVGVFRRIATCKTETNVVWETL